MGADRLLTDEHAAVVRAALDAGLDEAWLVIEGDCSDRTHSDEVTP